MHIITDKVAGLVLNKFNANKQAKGTQFPVK